jgi:hypothetical protein
LFPHRFAGVSEFKNFVRQADGLNETQHGANSVNLAAVNLPDKTTGFSLFFIVFQYSFGVSFRRPPVNARLKNFAIRRKQGGFTPVCRCWAAQKKIRTSCLKVSAVKIAKPKDVDYENQ